MNEKEICEALKFLIERDRKTEQQIKELKEMLLLTIDTMKNGSMHQELEKWIEEQKEK